MGYFKHDAIIVTSQFIEHAERASEKAAMLGLEVTSIEVSHTNGIASFLIIPDGSKEGWVESDKAAGLRKQWIEWAKAPSPPAYLDWIHVRFGGDDEVALIEDHGGSE